MALRIRNVSLLAKIETSYGVDVTPAAADGLYAVVGGLPTINKQDNTLNDVARGGVLSKMQPASPGPRSYQLSVRVPLRGRGAAYSASVKPKVDPLLRACGFQSTLTTTGGSEKVVYTPRSTGWESISLYAYLDGLLYKMLGCRGTVNFTMRTGGIAFAEFVLQAFYADPTDAAIVVPTGEPSLQPPTFVSSAFQMGTANYAAPFQSINVDMKNQITVAADSTKADGVGSIEIVDRIPDGSFDPEAALVATFNYYSAWKNQTLQDMTWQLGTAQYNRVKFSLPEVALSAVDVGDREGLAVFNTPFNVVSTSSAGDDEIEITFD